MPRATDRRSVHNFPWRFLLYTLTSLGVRFCLAVSVVVFAIVSMLFFYVGKVSNSLAFVSEMTGSEMICTP